MSEEDEEEYQAWKITADSGTYALKKAKEYELGVYRTFLSGLEHGVPHFFGSVNEDGENYILMEYVPGNSLTNSDRASVRAAVDALVCVQKNFWDETVLSGECSALRKA